MKPPQSTQKSKPLLRVRPRSDLEFPLRLHRRSGVVLHEQLGRQLRAAIQGGQLQAGSRLPSSRRLAEILRVDRNVVVIAFEELLSEGYLQARRGSGTFVSEGVTVPAAAQHPVMAGRERWLQKPAPIAPTDHAVPQQRLEFRLGQPSVAELDLTAWRRAWQSVSRIAPPDDYADPAGHPGFREAVAAYLGRARGLRCTADDVMVTSGIAQAVQVIARATLNPGDAVGFEEPGYRLIRHALLELGARISTVPVDDDGLRVDLLPTGQDAPLLLYCTPSHQYPLGSRLSVPRRLALLDWARANGALILEDDYDGEFRYDTAPLPALAALGADCTVYLGTVSKVLAPSLRLGYMVAPHSLRERLAQHKLLADYHTGLPAQQALEAFIRAGAFERHIWRMRRVYAHKRAVLARALEPIADVAPLRGLEAGLHAHLVLPEHIPAAKVATHLLEHGVLVSTLESYHAHEPRQNGLLLGYGAVAPAEIERGARAVVRAVQATARSLRNTVR